MNNKEENLAMLISEYLKRNKILFRFDIGADLKLTIGQAKRNKRKQMHERGFPDLMLFVNGKTIFIELKRSRDEIYKKNGEYRTNKHIQEQVAMHEKLRAEGFDVHFVWSFKQFLEILKETE